MRGLGGGEKDGTEEEGIFVAVGWIVWVDGNQRYSKRPSGTRKLKVQLVSCASLCQDAKLEYNLIENLCLP